MRLVLFMVTSAALTAAVTLGVPARARAGDHLACYKVKDTLAKGTFPNVTLSSNDGGPNNTGCTIKTGAKFCCDPVDKVGVPPQPGGSGAGALTTRFCCYKVKCPRIAGATLAFADQFGSRALPVTTPQILCAPVPTTSTTTTTGTTTTTTAPTCANGGITCGNHCGGGACNGVCIGASTSSSCPGVHCGSSAPVCVALNLGSTPCSSDAGCSAGEICLANMGASNCGVTNQSFCDTTCPE